MEITLNRAQITDAALIHAMQTAAFLPLYERYHDDETSPAKEPVGAVTARLMQPNTDYYIVHLDGEPVGAVRAVDHGTENGQRIYRISPLMILPAYQNRGIGSRVMQLVLAKYPEADLWRLSTILQEKGNCRLYEKCGFRQTGKLTPLNEQMTLVYYEKTVIHNGLHKTE